MGLKDFLKDIEDEKGGEEKKGHESFVDESNSDDEGEDEDKENEKPQKFGGFMKTKKGPSSLVIFILGR